MDDHTNLQAAREMVAAADREDARVANDAVKSCNCNASTLPHKHVASGIVDEK